MINKKLFDGFEISAIGQGMGQYKYDISQVDVIRFGVDHGLSTIDTCEDYAGGYSEVIIGKAIVGIRDKVIISTKFTAQNSTYNNVLLSAEKSMKRLGTDYIDIYQPHWPNPSIPLDETLSAMEKLVKDGKVRYLGFGNINLSELKRISSVLPIHIATVQMEYNLFNRTIEKNGILEYCNSNDILVIGYTPLDYGRVIDETHNKVIMKEIAARYGVTPAQLCLRWLVGHDPVITIPKTSSMTHALENATSMDFEISKEDEKTIDRISSKEIVYVKPSEIKVSPDGEGHKETYQTIAEAIENRLNFSPSPLELSKTITNEKPVKLILNTDVGEHKYVLVEGRVRYWAWVLAYGDEKIASLVRQNWW